MWTNLLGVESRLGSVYSVQRYKILLQEGQDQLQTCYKQFYKRLWSLELPFKIKITIWRCTRNFLPNYSNLHYRRLIDSTMCWRCHSGAETGMHLFRDCPERSVNNVRWVAPICPRIKINFDAACNRQRRESCSGLVVRNEKAEVVCSRSVLHVNVPSAVAAEALACFQALDLGVQLGLKEVEVEGDSRPVIRKLQM